MLIDMLSLTLCCKVKLNNLTNWFVDVLSSVHTRADPNLSFLPHLFFRIYLQHDVNW